MGWPLTLFEALLVVALGLVAIGSARGADPPQDREKEYQASVDRADARYRGALNACEAMQGNPREDCFREAKAIYIRAAADAKARLRGKTPGNL